VVDDEEKAAVRDWLLGREVNRQLLRPLRQGIARLLRQTAPPDVLRRPGIARPSGTLHWRQPYLGIQPPICLEDVDAEAEGIHVSREIGLLAFDLHRYATAKGRETKTLEASLVSEPDLLPLFFRALDYQRQLITTLEAQLGLSLESLALGLYSWGLVHLAPADSVCPAPLAGWMPTALPAHLTSPREQQITAWQDWRLLFDDFFKLRENLYDGQRITALLPTAGLEPVWAAVLALEPQRVDKGYRWAKRLLSNALTEWQTVMRQTLELDSPKRLSSETQAWLNRLSQGKGDDVLLVDLPPAVLTELAEHAPGVYRCLRVELGA
jgi:hypothetical protein